MFLMLPTLHVPSQPQNNSKTCSKLTLMKPKLRPTPVSVVNFERLLLIRGSIADFEH